MQYGDNTPERQRLQVLQHSGIRIFPGAAVLLRGINNVY